MDQHNLDELRELAADMHDRFVAICEEHNLSIDDGMEMLGLFITGAFFTMRDACVRFGITHPEGRVWASLSEICHAMAHVPGGQDSAGDAWLSHFGRGHVISMALRGDEDEK